MNLLLFGATGMVGTEALHAALDELRVTRVVAVVRRPTGVRHAKLLEVQHTDFTDFEPLRPHLQAADACLYCLGVYQGAVSTAEFWVVTCEYLAALIASLERTRPQIRFCLFSAQGADPTERRPILFAKAKGRAERQLTQSALKDHHIFRPGYIHPGRIASRTRIPAWLVSPLFRLVPAIGVEAVALARVMLQVAIAGGERRVYSNADIRRAAGAAGSAGPESL